VFRAGETVKLYMSTLSPKRYVGLLTGVKRVPVMGLAQSWAVAPRSISGVPPTTVPLITVELP